jgi:hypothetical protein
VPDDQVANTTLPASTRSAVAEPELLLKVTVRPSANDEDGPTANLSFIWRTGDDPEQRLDILTRLVAWAAGAITQIKRGSEPPQEGTETI